ncbi:alpha/beta fold hydrolase [Nocardia niigatensis]
MTELVTRDHDLVRGGRHELRLAYTESHLRSAAAAVKVVYLHGLLTDGTFWQPLISHAAERLGGRADHIALDARGHGRSQWPRRDVHNGLDTLADDLAALIEHLPTPVVLVAHSLGGFVLLEYARRHPRLFSQRVASVLGFAIAGELPEWAALKTFHRIAAPLRPLRHTRLDVVNATAHLMMQRRINTLAARAKPGRAQIIPASQPVDPRVTGDVFASLEAFRLDAATAATISRRPVHLIGGDYDAVVPATQLRRLAAQIPGARLTCLKATGHSLPRSQPALAAAFVGAAVDALTTAPAVMEVTQ